MRTLPHSAECGEFFLYLRPFCPNRRLRRKKTAQVREETPQLFAKTPLLSRKTCGLFAATRPLLTPLARHLLLSPPQRQDCPTFRTQNPRKIAQSRIHLDDSRLLSVENRFSDASTPFQATLPRTLLCQKTAICAKSPLFCHFVAEKRPATWGFLQTFFIFAF